MSWVHHHHLPLPARLGSSLLTPAHSRARPRPCARPRARLFGHPHHADGKEALLPGRLYGLGGRAQVAAGKPSVPPFPSSLPPFPPTNPFQPLASTCPFSSWAGRPRSVPSLCSIQLSSTLNTPPPPPSPPQCQARAQPYPAISEWFSGRRSSFQAPIKNLGPNAIKLESEIFWSPEVYHPSCASCPFYTGQS
jgi:hypothetical protein